MSNVARFLDRANAAASAKHPLRLTVREFLAEWDAYKRGSQIVAKITDDLEQYGLATVPPFTQPGIDEELQLVLRGRAGTSPAPGPSKAANSGTLSAAARQLLASVPTDGSSIGGAALRSAVDLDDAVYAAALSEVQRSGQVIVGPGRGGSIRRSSASTTEPPETLAQQKKAEKSLYQPFLHWLRSSWPASLDQDEDKLREAEITATPKGYKQNTGRWRRPDVTELSVYRYELLPPAQRIQLELSSYEIKPQGVDLIAAVLEAAAQARWSHRSTLVIEAPSKDWTAPARISSEVRRFGVGLYYMTKVDERPGGTERYDIRVVLEPSLQSPDPEDLQDAIGHFVALVPGLKRKYLGAIAT